MTAGVEPTAAEADAKAAADAAAAKEALAAAGQGGVKLPETYTVTKPDGSLLPETALARVGEMAKALKLASDADAQSVYAFADESVKEAITTYEAARKPDGAVYREVAKQYTEAALKHPKLGNGDARQLENKALRAGLFLNQYADPAFTEVLKTSGLAGHPDFLLFANAMLDRFSEKPLAKADDGPAKPKPESFEDRMYGKKDQK